MFVQKCKGLDEHSSICHYVWNFVRTGGTGQRATLMDTSLQFASSALYAVKAVGFAFWAASFPDWYEHGSASAAAQG